jgi:hypothetical protein
VVALFTSNDAQQVGAQLGMHATFLLLNKMLNGATPGSVRDYVFAFKLISVPLLPCLIYTNSLLRNISSKPNLNTGCLTREVIRATGFTQGYALGVTGFLCLTAAYVPQIVFFHAAFEQAQYIRISELLKILALAVPASAHLYLWPRVYAARGTSQYTLLSTVFRLGIWIAVMTTAGSLQPEQAAMLWAVGSTIQAIQLMALAGLPPGGGPANAVCSPAGYIGAAAVAGLVGYLFAGSLKTNYPLLILLNALLLAQSVFVLRKASLLPHISMPAPVAG